MGMNSYGGGMGMSSYGGMGGMGGMGGGMGMNRMNMMNNNANTLQNPLQGQNPAAPGAAPAPGQPAANPITRAQIILSGAQEITQAFVSLVEVTIQFAILALSAMCTYSQVQQVGQEGGPPGMEGGSAMPMSMPWGAAKATTAGAAATPAVESAWLSKSSRRQLLTIAISVSLYFGLSRIVSRIKKSLTPAVQVRSSHVAGVEREGATHSAYSAVRDFCEADEDALAPGESFGVAMFAYEAENDDELSLNEVCDAKAQHQPPLSTERQTQDPRPLRELVECLSLLRPRHHWPGPIKPGSDPLQK